MEHSVISISKTDSFEQYEDDIVALRFKLFKKFYPDIKSVSEVKHTFVTETDFTGTHFMYHHDDTMVGTARLSVHHRPEFIPIYSFLPSQVKTQLTNSKRKIAYLNTALFEDDYTDFKQNLNELRFKAARDQGCNEILLMGYKDECESMKKMGFGTLHKLEKSVTPNRIFNKMIEQSDIYVLISEL